MAATGFAQQPIVVGRTLSSDKADIVQLASIVHVKTGKRYISNRQGYFRMLLNEGDTVLVTAIGYDSTFFVGTASETKEDTLLVLLKSKTVKLKELRVVTSNPRRDSIARAAAEFLKTDPLMNNYDRILNREKGGLMSPLTAMYQEFSKEGRDAAKFEEFLAYMEKQKQVDRRYNRALVKKATRIPEIQIDEFMVYCRPDKDFVIHASEYDLIKKVQECERDFYARPK